MSFLSHDHGLMKVGRGSAQKLQGKRAECPHVTVFRGLCARRLPGLSAPGALCARRPSFPQEETCPSVPASHQPAQHSAPAQPRFHSPTLPHGALGICFISLHNWLIPDQDCFTQRFAFLSCPLPFLFQKNLVLSVLGSKNKLLVFV